MKSWLGLLEWLVQSGDTSVMCVTRVLIKWGFPIVSLDRWLGAMISQGWRHRSHREVDVILSDMITSLVRVNDEVRGRGVHYCKPFFIREESIFASYIDHIV